MADTRRTAPVALHLTRNLLRGGAERIFVNYVNHAESIVPIVALLERRGPLLEELRPGVPVLARVDHTHPPSRAESLATEIPGETFVRLLPECLWLRDVIRQTGASIVSSFLMRAHIVALLTRALLAPDVRLVLNVHEHMSESAAFLYPKRRDRTMMRWVTRHLFPRADRIIVVAEELERDLVHSFGLPARMIDVVHNGIDLEHVRRAAGEPAELPGAADGAETVVAVGRLVHLKGYDLLLRALATVRQSRDVRLVLIGDGEERDNLQRLASELGIAEAVTFAGQRRNPWRLMGRAHALALTSRTEAFPCVLAEAMALEVPIVATNCSGGVREALEDGACGMIVAPDDPAAIASGLTRLLADSSLRARLTAAGVARAAAFDLRLVQRRYESVLTAEAAIADRTT